MGGTRLDAWDPCYFPPPEVLGHVGGKDSISEKKAAKGDCKFKTNEVLLGFGARGAAHDGRTVCLPEDKRDRYIAAIRGALAKPRNYISLSEFQKIHGKLQHVSAILPMMRGFMTPLNKVLAQAHPVVGLSHRSQTREILEAFIIMLEVAHARPSHITELVGPYLPHYHGYVDAAARGVGGVWFPCTRPLCIGGVACVLVWRVRWPDDVCREVQKADGSINNNDVEAAATFIGESILDDQLEGHTAGVSSHLGSDNTCAVSWNNRMATRATHQFPERLLRWKALRQRWTRRGPQDTTHVEGEKNEMADIPSRSYDEFCKLGPDQDTEFLAYFSQRFPLPSQLGSWRLVRPRTEVVSAVISLLRGQIDTTNRHGTCTGDGGVVLPPMLASTLSSPECKAPPSTWNEASCSWPLLLPSGKEHTSEVASLLQARRSRKRYAGVDGVWLPAGLETLAEQIRPSTTSTTPSPLSSHSASSETQHPNRSLRFPTPPFGGSPEHTEHLL